MKNQRYWRYLLGLGLGLAVVFLAGCRGFLGPIEDPTRFYVLGLPEYEPVTEARLTESVTVGLARVRVARYLEESGIAIRENGSRMVYSQRHRWAESLEHGLTRTVSEALTEEPVVARVTSHAVPRRRLPDVDLHISLSRAEGVVDGAEAYAMFRASWELQAGVDADVVASGTVRADRLPWDGENFEELVASLSQGASQLTQDVARALEEL